MADHALAGALRIALEALVKQRQTAGENLRRQRAAVESAVHNLEKAREVESIATRDANEKSDNVQSLINLSNSKPTEERSAFQGAIAHLQEAQSDAAKTRDARAKLVKEQELTYHYAKVGLKETEEKLAEIQNQVSSLENELSQALR